MPHKTFHVMPAKLIDGDPFGLHEPPTLRDLERIEQALADGSVTGAEADRLRAIRDEESAELTQAFRGITKTLNAHFGDVLTKMDMGSKYADLRPKFVMGPKIADLLPKSDFAPKIADLLPKTDFAPKIADLLPKIEFASLLGDLARPQLGSLVLSPDATPKFELSAIEPLDFKLLVDERPAHMEELAERQLVALNAACASLEATADAIVKSDQRAEERFAESRHMNHSQTRTVVIVTIVAALLSGLAGAVLATLLQ